MLPYWLLFVLFAAGALRFGTAQTAPQRAGESRRLPTRVTPQQQHELESNKSYARLLPVAAVVPALMIGLRYAVGTDWGAYVTIFKEIARSDLGSALVRIDPGYALLNWLAAAAGAELWTVNLVCGAVFMFGLVRFAHAQPNPWLAISVAVPYLIIGVGMGYSRQAVAIALAMAGLADISRRARLSRVILWILAGALFHRTVVVVIPVVALAYTRNRLQSAFLGAVGMLLGYYLLTLGQGLEHFQSAYIRRAYESQGAIFRLAMNVPPAIAYLLSSTRFTTDETERKVWRNFAVVAALSIIAWYFVTSTAALDRMALYVIPLQLFVLSRLPGVLSRQRRPALIFVLAVIIYSAAVQLVWLQFSNNSKNWIPYKAYYFNATA